MSIARELGKQAADVSPASDMASRRAIRETVNSYDPKVPGAYDTTINTLNRLGRGVGTVEGVKSLPGTISRFVQDDLARTNRAFDMDFTPRTDRSDVLEFAKQRIKDKTPGLMSFNEAVVDLASDDRLPKHGGDLLKRLMGYLQNRDSNVMPITGLK